MRRLLRFTSASLATGLFASAALVELSKKNWDMREKETVTLLVTAGVLTALTWTATLV